jgi:hypothetical protein
MTGWCSIRVWVNGELLVVHYSVTGELDSAPELRAGFARRIARAEAEFRSQERWGAGKLGGESPAFTWTAATGSAV